MLENSSEILNSQRVVLSSGGLGGAVFEGGDPKPNRQRRVLELGTRVRPPKQLDRVVAGQVRGVRRVGGGDG